MMPLLRPYEPGDQQAVRDLFIQINRMIAPPGQEAQFEAYITRSLLEEIDRIPAYYDETLGSGFWVLVQDQALIGYFGLEPHGRGAFELRRMYVDPLMRGRGHARSMLAEAERIAADRGAQRLVLSTSELQPAALGLYRTSGYSITKEEIAATASNKTVGGGIRRFHFEKTLPTPEAAP